MNIFTIISESFGEDAVKFLVELGAAIENLGVKSFLVGGPVRDALLRLPTDDIDVVLEGSAGDIVSRLKSDWPRYFPNRECPRSLTVYKKYDTAKFLFSNPVCARISRIDFSSARREEYPVSGGAPVVNRGSFLEDLARRDFSINAMAMSLNEEEFGMLCDPLGGERDLEGKILRVFHSQSFVDDPVRLVRGVRFSVRFEFLFDPETLKLFENGLSEKLLLRVPAPRRFDELTKALAEPQLLPIVLRLANLGLLKCIHPELIVSNEFVDIGEARMKYVVDGASKGASHYDWKEPLLCLMPKCSDTKFREVILEMGGSTQILDALLKLRAERN